MPLNQDTYHKLFHREQENYRGYVYYSHLINKDPVTECASYGNSCSCSAGRAIFFGKKDSDNDLDLTSPFMKRESDPSGSTQCVWSSFAKTPFTHNQILSTATAVELTLSRLKGVNMEQNPQGPISGWPANTQSPSNPVNCVQNTSHPSWLYDGASGCCYIYNGVHENYEWSAWFKEREFIIDRIEFLNYYGRE